MERLFHSTDRLDPVTQMADAFWIRSKQRVHGPFTADQLRKLAKKGELKPGHYVSRDQKKWALASQVNGLDVSGSDHVAHPASTNPPKESSDHTRENDESTGASSSLRVETRHHWVGIVIAVFLHFVVAVVIYDMATVSERGGYFGKATTASFTIGSGWLALLLAGTACATVFHLSKMPGVWLVGLAFCSYSILFTTEVVSDRVYYLGNFYWSHCKPFLNYWSLSLMVVGFVLMASIPAWFQRFWIPAAAAAMLIPFALTYAEVVSPDPIKRLIFASALAVCAVVIFLCRIGFPSLMVASALALLSVKGIEVWADLSSFQSSFQQLQEGVLRGEREALFSYLQAVAQVRSYSYVYLVTLIALGVASLALGAEVKNDHTASSVRPDRSLQNPFLLAFIGLLPWSIPWILGTGQPEEYGSVVSLVAVVGSNLLWLFWLGRTIVWLRKADSSAFPIHPAKALGGMLVPIFNSYWTPLVLYKVTRAIGRQVRQSRTASSLNFPELVLFAMLLELFLLVGVGVGFRSLGTEYMLAWLYLTIWTVTAYIQFHLNRIGPRPLREQWK